MTKFTDLATLDKLCGIMGLLVREGRAAAAPKMAKHAQMGDQSIEEQEETFAVDYVECIGYEFSETNPKCIRQMEKVNQSATSMKFCGTALPWMPHCRLLLPAPCLRQTW